MNNIFISYRRADSADVVGRIYDHLQGVVGKDNIFKDVHSVQAGIDYLEFTSGILEKCDVQLAIIGNQWLSGRRIDNPEDLVRVEIETAMGRDIPVIPVLVGGAEMPAESELPDSLKPLAYRNAMKVRPDPDFPTDMDRLVRALGGIIPIKSHATSGRPKWLPWAAGMVVVVAAISFFVFKGFPENLSGPGYAVMGPDDSGPSAANVEDAGQVDRAMEYVNRFNGTGQLLDAKNKISGATTRAIDELNSVLTNPEFEGRDDLLAQAYNSTILSMVEREDLGTSLELLFRFHEEQLTCRDMGLCDEPVTARFLDADAGDLVNTFYPWVCKIRSDFNNPEEFSGVMDFYLGERSLTVCDA